MARFSSPGIPKIRSTPSFSKAEMSRSEPFIRPLLPRHRRLEASTRLIQLTQVIELLRPKKRNFQTLLSLGTPSDALIRITGSDHGPERPACSGREPTSKQSDCKYHCCSTLLGGSPFLTDLSLQGMPGSVFRRGARDLIDKVIN